MRTNPSSCNPTSDYSLDILIPLIAQGWVGRAVSHLEEFLRAVISSWEPSSIRSFALHPAQQRTLSHDTLHASPDLEEIRLGER